jgi:hypothetical protein
MAIHDADLYRQLLNKTTDIQLMFFTALSVIDRFPVVFNEAYNRMYAGDRDALPACQRYQPQQAAADAYFTWSQSLHPDSPELEGLPQDLREALPRVFSADLSVRPAEEELLALPCFAQYIPLVTGIVDQCCGEHLLEHEAVRAYMAQHLTADDHPVLAQQRYEVALRRQEEERFAAAYLAQQERERQLREHHVLQQQAMAAAARRNPIGPPPGLDAYKPAGKPLPDTPPVPAMLLHICQQRKHLQQHHLQHKQLQQKTWQQEPLQHKWQQVQQQRTRQQPTPQQTWQQKHLQPTWQQQQHGYKRAPCGKHRCNNKRTRAHQQEQQPLLRQVTAGPVAATRQFSLAALLRSAQDKFRQGQRACWQGQHQM